MLRTSFFLAASLVIAGCTDPDDPLPSYVGLFDQGSTEAETLATHQINPTTSAVTTASSEFDRSADRIVINGLAGDIDDARVNVTLDEGGFITIVDGPTDYVARYEAQLQTGDPFFGVIGVPTLVTDLPSPGVATYTGVASSQIQIIDGSAVYDLTGTTNASVDFGAGNVDITLSDLAGTRTDGVSAATSVNDVAVIRIEDAGLSGSTFSGGSAVFDSSQISTVLSGTEVVNTSGGLFGPNGDELGGVLLIDDTSGAGTLLIQGTFTAD
jgi:hypothetical protein